MSDPERLTEPPRRAHRVMVPILLALASLALFTGAFAVWVHRQALNTDNWKTTSSKLLADKQVQAALAPYMVDQLFTNVDVTGAIQQRLPSNLQVLAGPASAGLRQLADRAAPKLLARPKVQDAWVTANAAAHEQLLRIINGGGARRLDRRRGGHARPPRARQAAGGRPRSVESGGRGAGKAPGSGRRAGEGAASAAARHHRADTSGRLVIMRSNQLKTSQDAAGAVNSLAIVLPALAIVLFALAIWLARGRRRRALRSAGWSFVVVGLLLLLVRRIGGNQIVDSLVKVPSNEAAVHQAWVIATSLLFAIAVALIVYGVVFALAAWLGGPTRPARFLRKLAAPELRESPGVAYAAAGGLLLGACRLGPDAGFRQLAWILCSRRCSRWASPSCAARPRSSSRASSAATPCGSSANAGRRRGRESRAAGAPAASPAVPAGSGPTQAVDELERRRPSTTPGSCPTPSSPPPRRESRTALSLPAAASPRASSAASPHGEPLSLRGAGSCRDPGRPPRPTTAIVWASAGRRRRLARRSGAHLGAGPLRRASLTRRERRTPYPRSQAAGRPRLAHHDAREYGARQPLEHGARSRSRFGPGCGRLGRRPRAPAWDELRAPLPNRHRRSLPCGSGRLTRAPPQVHRLSKPRGQKGDGRPAIP